jgi:selenocysteine lyase/cysteine desulfurase
MLRRDFLFRAGQTVGAAVVLSALRDAEAAIASMQSQFGDWDSVRALFPVQPGLLHFSSFFLASHPKPVREQIEAHRQGLDANPMEYWEANERKFEAAQVAAASRYLGVKPEDIALTDSTTMGLGLLYSGLKLDPRDEILTTTHDHYSTETALRLRAERTGAKVRSVALYEDPEKATEASLTSRLLAAVSPATRVIAVTWVHSVSGIKLPLAMMTREIAAVNATRSLEKRILFCADGVHGLGAEGATMQELGVDFFIAGTHKWIFGPRGTGLVWGKPEAWSRATATIPTFDADTYEIWMNILRPRPIPIGATMSPGGFHAFEHRWSVHRAFELHEAIGKTRIRDRIHDQARQLKEGLLKIPKVRLRTPLAQNVSAGIVCFEVEGLSAEAAVQKLRAKGIVGSMTPYKTHYARLAPSLLTTPAEVDRVLAAVREL